MPDTLTARFRYKCRRCGTEFSESCTGTDKDGLRAQHMLICAIDGDASRKGDMISMLTVHTCDVHVMARYRVARGIADLVGFEASEE